mgnify:CR=1 FL=1
MALPGRTGGGQAENSPGAATASDPCRAPLEGGPQVWGQDAGNMLAAQRITLHH